MCTLLYETYSNIKVPLSWLFPHYFLTRNDRTDRMRWQKEEEKNGIPIKLANQILLSLAPSNLNGLLAVPFRCFSQFLSVFSAHCVVAHAMPIEKHSHNVGYPVKLGWAAKKRPYFWFNLQSSIPHACFNRVQKPAQS